MVTKSVLCLKNKKGRSIRIRIETKLYEPYMKDTVSLYLYNLDKQGVIKRTKKGRTYSLEII